MGTLAGKQALLQLLRGIQTSPRVVPFLEERRKDFFSMAIFFVVVIMRAKSGSNQLKRALTKLLTKEKILFVLGSSVRRVLMELQWDADTIGSLSDQAYLSLRLLIECLPEALRLAKIVIPNSDSEICFHHLCDAGES